MESARDFIKRFSRNSIKLLFGKRSTNPLRCCRMIWMNGCGNTMNYVRTAENIVMEKRLCRHSWIPCLLQKRKCCSIVTTFQTKRKYDRSSDDVVTSTVNHLFFRASKPFRRTNPDFFTKNGKKSNFGPFSSSPVNAVCSRYPVVYVSLISSIQAC